MWVSFLEEGDGVRIFVCMCVVLECLEQGAGLRIRIRPLVGNRSPSRIRRQL